jgi:hypothetical protein
MNFLQAFEVSLFTKMENRVSENNEWLMKWITDCLCGLVVRVPGYRWIGPGFDSRRYQIFWEVVGLERVHKASWV